MLIVDEETAVLAIPHLLPESIEERREAFGVLRQVLEAPGALPEEAAARLQEVSALFGLGSARSRLRRSLRASASPPRGSVRPSGPQGSRRGPDADAGSGFMKTAIKARPPPG